MFFGVFGFRFFASTIPSDRKEGSKAEPCRVYVGGAGLISIISTQLPRKNNADGLSVLLVKWSPLAYENHSHTWDRLVERGGRE